MSSTYAPKRREQSTWSWDNNDVEYSTDADPYHDYNTDFPSMTADFAQTAEEFTDDNDYYVQPKEEVTFTPEPIIPTATEDIPYTMYEL